MAFEDFINQKTAGILMGLGTVLMITSFLVAWQKFAFNTTGIAFFAAGLGLYLGLKALGLD